jgi:glucuronoarabinoxylan endo-1,4-beta-xylanase
MFDSRWLTAGLATILLLAVEGCIQRDRAESCASDAALGSAACAGPPEQATVTIDLGTKYQTLEGFGASTAWYQGTLVRHTRKAEIYQLIFGDLGLDILRFRNRFQRSKPDDNDLAEEAEILQRATQSLGRRPKLMLCSWSPPGSLKANAQEDCAGNADCTLRKIGGRFVYAEFADYWYDSVQRYAALGMLPDYVSIQNEPSFLPPSWEGCKFEPRETEDYPGYDRALRAVHQRLSQLPAPPRLVGPEVLGVHWERPQKYVGAMNLELVFAVAHHLYERGNDNVWDWREPGPDSYSDEMRATAQLVGGRPLFQTEFQTDEDEGIEGGLETAWLIHNSLVEEGVAAWLYWDLVWVKGSGLVTMIGNRYRVRDQYYSLRHYARFTDPGYVRVGAAASSADVRASAYLAPDGRRLTVVVLNVGRQYQHATLLLPEQRGSASKVFRTVYRPGKSETWVSLGSLPPNRTVVLPPRSIATVALD